jgi:hypothetical protein
MRRTHVLEDYRLRLSFDALYGHDKIEVVRNIKNRGKQEAGVLGMLYLLNQRPIYLKLICLGCAQICERRNARSKIINGDLTAQCV